MIPSTSSRLLITEDWTKIYQSFRNADFKSYDFETLRRTMITYLRERYPEDFNDYIESSEYIALIDLIAFLGQNLSFRIDLNARENFLETAERRESILRLAKLINYNAKRNIPAAGMLKLSNISTTESVIDANGINLANTIITWNDATNPEWYQQFISIINNAMPSQMVFGKPNDRASISGISTERYQINSTSNDVPIYSFSKNINGTAMAFEIVSSVLSSDAIVEEAPKPANQLGFIYKNDNRGFGSSNTGFFVHFKQGTLAMSKFNVDSPVPNEIIGINAPNINDTDVWLWQLNSSGAYDTSPWTKVNAIIGNNVIYNSISNEVRNIYSVLSRDQDQIDLSFSDGSFGNLPKGQFRLFYRQSNGLTYSVTPENLSNITIQVPYLNKIGQRHQLTVTVSLQYTVTTASGPESNTDIKLKAPQTYYTQNRMITAEDYNIAPLSVSSDVLKVKSINRVSSGISKYFELSDVSGKYSKTNIFATDGIIYKNPIENNFQFSFTNRSEVIAVIKSQLGPIMRSPSFKNFYMENYPRVSYSSTSTAWVTVTKTTNQTTGYFANASGPLTIGPYTSDDRKFLVPETLVKIIPPTGRYFLPNGKLTTINDAKTRSYIWSKIVNVVGDGANSGAGILLNGTGPVIISGVIQGDSSYSPTLSPILSESIPKFVTTLTFGFESEMVTKVLAQSNFGLGYDTSTMSWYIISEANLAYNADFSLANKQSTANTGLDASWMVAFVWDGRRYQVKYRILDYIFESEKETAFFVDNTSVNFDFTTNSVIKDEIAVLSINTSPITTSIQLLGADYSWQIDSSIIENDGYLNPKKVNISFFDANNDGQLDDPDAFNQIVKPYSVSPQTGYLDKFVYFNQPSPTDINIVSDVEILSYPSDTAVINPIDGQLYYFYDPAIDVLKTYSAATLNYILAPTYTAKSGRSDLKFHYIHNSGENKRLDPSKTNIIDVYILSKSYDTAYRNWITYGAGNAPLPPTSQELSNLYNAQLESIKSISDELIFHPASYRVLFGQNAISGLQATFTAVRNASKSNSDNDLKSRILVAITEFFNIDNWGFGNTFYFSELLTYVMNKLTPDITNLIIVPAANGNAGSLYEVACQSNEIFISGITANDISIVSSI